MKSEYRGAGISASGPKRDDFLLGILPLRARVLVAHACTMLQSTIGATRTLFHYQFNNLQKKNAISEYGTDALSFKMELKIHAIMWICGDDSNNLVGPAQPSSPLLQETLSLVVVSMCVLVCVCDCVCACMRVLECVHVCGYDAVWVKPRMQVMAKAKNVQVYWYRLTSSFVDSEIVMVDCELWNNHFRDLGHPPQLYGVQDPGWLMVSPVNNKVLSLWQT